MLFPADVGDTLPTPSLRHLSLLCERLVLSMYAACVVILYAYTGIVFIYLLKVNKQKPKAKEKKTETTAQNKSIQSIDSKKDRCTVRKMYINLATIASALFF